MQCLIYRNGSGIWWFGSDIPRYGESDMEELMHLMSQTSIEYMLKQSYITVMIDWHYYRGFILTIEISDLGDNLIELLKESST